MIRRAQGLRGMLLWIGIGAAAGCSSPRGSPRALYDIPPASLVRIVRDTYGVPHILAQNEASLFYGVGYAQAKDHLERIIRNYLLASGNLASVDGREALERDRFVRSFQLLEQASRALPDLDPRVKGHLLAYTSGINSYIERWKAGLPGWIRRVRPEETLAFAMYVNVSFALGSARQDLGTRGIGLPALLPEGGSNQFAVSPWRSSRGHAILSMDPHLPLSGVTRWHEAHLVAPGLNVMGATFPGLPYIAMGHNDRIAWSMTVNDLDLADAWEVEIDPRDPNRYRGPLGWMEFAVKEIRLYLKTETGPIVPVEGTIRFTVHGPVVQEQNGRAYAIGVAGANRPGAIATLYHLNKARDLGEFRRALAGGDLVMFNIVYADVDGNICYIDNGRVPIRHRAVDPSKPLDGADLRSLWRGFHSFWKLPQIANPRAGFLQDCNSGPLSVTPDPVFRREDFPGYFFRHRENDRSRRLKSLLHRHAALTLEDAMAIAADPYLKGAERNVPRIIGSVADSGTGAPEIAREAARVLREWDRSAGRESAGAALYARWIDEVQGAGLLGRLDGWLQSGEARRGIVQALARAAEGVKEDLGDLSAPWGEFHRIRRGTVDMGAVGMARPAGTSLRSTAAERDGSREYISSGTSYAMVVEMSTPPRAFSSLPFGSTDRAGSPHSTDQIGLYARGEYKPAWFTPAELAAHRREPETILRVPSWEGRGPFRESYR